MPKHHGETVPLKWALLCTLLFRIPIDDNERNKSNWEFVHDEHTEDEIEALRC